MLSTFTLVPLAFNRACNTPLVLICAFMFGVLSVANVNHAVFVTDFGRPVAIVAQAVELILNPSNCTNATFPAMQYLMAPETPDGYPDAGTVVHAVGFISGFNRVEVI